MKNVLICVLLYFEVVGIYSAVNRMYLICDAKRRIRQLKKNKRK